MYRRENDGAAITEDQVPEHFFQGRCVISYGQQWRGTRYGGISASAIPMKPIAFQDFYQPLDWRKGCLKK